MSRRPAPATDRTATYRQVFASREFSFMILGQGITLLGDQALRVALALLVYHHSHSALLTAFAYSLTFLPWVISGPLLAGYADRLPRRRVLIAGNLARAGIIALMALPHVPIAGLLLLVLLAEFLAPPINAAAFAVLPEILTGDRYVVGVSLSQGVIQASQILGFGAGGAVVGQIGARAAFGADAVSFLLAALVFRIALRHPYLAENPPEAGAFWSDTRDGFRTALGRAAPRNLLLLAWWGGVVLLVPEGLAAPLAATLTHNGDSATGWLLAAPATGMIVGMIVMGRFTRPSRRTQLMRPLAVVCLLPLIVFGLQPSLAVALVLLVLTGMACSYQVPLQAAFVATIPSEQRGRAFGVAAAGIQVSQGIGVLLGGGLAKLVGVVPAIATAGCAGAVVMAGIAALRTPAT